MGHELSLDVLRAGQLSRELLESQQRMRLAACAADLSLWEWMWFGTKFGQPRKAASVPGLTQPNALILPAICNRFIPMTVNRLSGRCAKRLKSMANSRLSIA